jgi:hypothetical protein
VKRSPTSVRTVSKAAAKETKDLVGNPTRPHCNAVQGLKLKVLLLSGVSVIPSPEVINSFTGNREDDFEEVKTLGPPLSEPSFKTESLAALIKEHPRGTLPQSGYDIRYNRSGGLFHQVSELLFE